MDGISLALITICLNEQRRRNAFLHQRVQRNFFRSGKNVGCGGEYDEMSVMVYFVVLEVWGNESMNQCLWTVGLLN